MEPSRQSTSDSEAYPRGNGYGPAPKNIVVVEEGGAEEDLAALVAGWKDFVVEEPEFDDEEPKWDAKGKLKMPEPQYFPTRLSTTQEEDEDIYDYQDDEGDQTMRMPEPFMHSRDQTSSTAQTLHAQTSSGVPSPFTTGTTVRKVSPLIIPPTPKSTPPVPSSVRGENQAAILTPAGHGKSSSSTEPKPQHDEDKFQGTHSLPAGPSNPNPGGSPGGVAPLRIQRHPKRPPSATAAGGEGIPSASTSAENESVSQHQYGTAVITGMASSRVDRPERPGSGWGLARTSVDSTSISRTPSGRVKTESTSHHRPSMDAYTYPHGRTTTSASASGANRPPETRSGGSIGHRLPPLPRQERERRSASEALDAAAMGGRPRLPRGVSSQMDTQYVNMLLALDDIPTIHNLAAAFFNWIYLAGFVLFPGTFTSLRTLGAEQGNAVAAELIKTVTQLPLWVSLISYFFFLIFLISFIVAWICVGIGAAGMLWLFWRWHKNYLWLLNKIWT
jgi:hypothetical protein